MSSAVIANPATWTQSASDLAPRLSRLVLADAVPDETAIEIHSADSAYRCSAQRHRTTRLASSRLEVGGTVSASNEANVTLAEMPPAEVLLAALGGDEIIDTHFSTT